MATSDARRHRPCRLCRRGAGARRVRPDTRVHADVVARSGVDALERHPGWQEEKVPVEILFVVPAVRHGVCEGRFERGRRVRPGSQTTETNATVAVWTCGWRARGGGRCRSRRG